MLPYLPSPEVVDRVGMIPVIMTLGASLRPGDYCRNVQCDKVSNTSTWYGNAYDAGSAYAGAASGDGYLASASHTTGEWYSCQARGTKQRMGVLRFQNKALTSQIVLVRDDILEKEWQRSNGSTHHETMKELMSFVLIGFGDRLSNQTLGFVALFLHINSIVSDLINLVFK